MEKIVEALKAGKIIVHNTDTCLGMAVDILNEEVITLLYKVKRMSKDKPVSISCSDIEMASRYGLFSEKALELAEKCLPGALTLIVPRTKNLPEWINPGLDSIGIRIPNDEFSLKMVCDFGNPVTTTSCNVSGEQVCLSDSQVRGVFGKYVDSGELIVAFDGDTHPKISTIIKVVGDSIEIIRQGEVRLDV
ncbi:MAG: L-threonylcarbamoyladenylate synthase [Candidatus Peregrinibacteria bacterium]|nr:L-threonylcarbamoyladenylate synthase [Candidatus Peregrinibacteria bacterium]MDZ4244997.1 L-threonylcarbamoyladenylate synthase [Candidatus Gracilibacteria bacterium]